MEFEKRNDILVFPLPASVCGTVRKEPDFFVIKNGKFAILELLNDHYHASVVKEADRNKWFQDHGIQIRSYDTNECFKKPQWVLNDFITWLDKL